MRSRSSDGKSDKDPMGPLLGSFFLGGLYDAPHMPWGTVDTEHLTASQRWGCTTSFKPIRLSSKLKALNTPSAEVRSL